MNANELLAYIENCAQNMLKLDRDVLATPQELARISRKSLDRLAQIENSQGKAILVLQFECYK